MNQDQTTKAGAITDCLLSTASGHLTF